MKTLAILLVLLLQTAPIDPLAGLPAALRNLRDHLDEHKQTFGATPELTAAKHQLRDWVESRLAGLGRDADTRVFADTLHAALGKANLLCNDLVDQCDWNFLGYVDDVRVSRADDLLVVVTATGIYCGYDESAYAYAWEGQQWRRVWEHERNTYTQSEYLPQIIHDVLISPPDASRARLLMTLGSQTICGGAFKDVYARAWRMDGNYVAARVLDWTAHANDAYPPLQGRVLPDDILLQFTAGGLLSGEVHTAVRHFKIAQGSAIQVDPVAGLPRDFVVEWLTAPWEQSRTRSEPGTLEASHAQLHRLDGVGDVPDQTVRRCTADADVWQVGTHLYERPKRYYRVRWRSPYTFTMVGVSETPYPDCTVEDPRGETYSNLLAADLR